MEFPTKAKALVQLQKLVLKINEPDAFRAHNKVTMGVLIDRFETEERLEESVRQAPGEVTITNGLSCSTAAGYRSYLNKHVKPRWLKTAIVDMKALEILDWLKSLPLAPKTPAQMRALLHLLFERAMLWGLIQLQRNPIELVRLKGTSRRTRKPQILLPEKFQQLTAILPEPYRTMSVVAMCTGLRVSEVLALRWGLIDFYAGILLVEEGVVNGRVGRVKNDALHYFVPLDPAFVQVLLDWKGSCSSGIVFASHVTGGCYYAGIIQRQILRPRGAQVGIVNLGWHPSGTRIVPCWTRQALRSVSNRS